MADHVLVYLEAYACDDNGDGPRWARLSVDAAFLARVSYLAALVEAHRLASVNTYDAPEAWDGEAELRLRNHALVVSGGDFWFEAHPKHATYHVETRMVDVREFVATVGEALERGGTDPVLYFGNEDAAAVAHEAEEERRAEASHG